MCSRGVSEEFQGNRGGLNVGLEVSEEFQEYLRVSVRGFHGVQGVSKGLSGHFRRSSTDLQRDLKGFKGSFMVIQGDSSRFPGGGWISGVKEEFLQKNL